MSLKQMKAISFINILLCCTCCCVVVAGPALIVSSIADLNVMKYGDKVGLERLNIT